MTLTKAKIRAQMSKIGQENACLRTENDALRDSLNEQIENVKKLNAALAESSDALAASMATNEKLSKIDPRPWWKLWCNHDWFTNRGGWETCRRCGADRGDPRDT